MPVMGPLGLPAAGQCGQGPPTPAPAVEPGSRWGGVRTGPWRGSWRSRRKTAALQGWD